MSDPLCQPYFRLRRDDVIEFAKLWPGHAGVNYETTTTANLLLLIADAVRGDRAELRKLRAAQPEVSAPTVIERTGDGRLRVLHAWQDETPARLAAALVTLAFGDLDARVAAEVRDGTFEPRTAQGMLHLAREAFAAVSTDLRDLDTRATDAACLDAVRNGRTMLDQIDREELL